MTRPSIALAVLAALLGGGPAVTADPKLPPGVTLEQEVTDPAAAKVVLIAGSRLVNRPMSATMSAPGIGTTAAPADASERFVTSV